MLKFIKGSYEEFKTVQWPTRKQTTRLTIYVIGVSVVVSLYVGGADYIFTKALGLLLIR